MDPDSGGPKHVDPDPDSDPDPQHWQAVRLEVRKNFFSSAE
jgi:hypothetical protein